MSAGNGVHQNRYSHPSAKVRTTVVKRVGARFGLALVPIVPLWELFVQTYLHLKSMLTISFTTASVERAVYQDSGVTVINILAKSLRRRTIELQLLWLLCIAV